MIVNKSDLEAIRETLQEHYNLFSMKVKKQLEQDGFGDCPRDYACSVLANVLDEENNF